jgi:hypothetical protein
MDLIYYHSPMHIRLWVVSLVAHILMSLETISYSYRPVTYFLVFEMVIVGSAHSCIWSTIMTDFVIETGIVNELTLLGVLRHISPPAGYSTHTPHSSFVLPLTRNPVAKIKIPYSFVLVRMSRDLQFLRTLMGSSWCKACALLNRAIVRLDSTHGIHVRLCFFCTCAPMYVNAWRPLSRKHSRMFIMKISKSLENVKPCKKFVCSAILIEKWVQMSNWSISSCRLPEVSNDNWIATVRMTMAARCSVSVEKRIIFFAK